MPSAVACEWLLERGCHETPRSASKNVCTFELTWIKLRNLEAFCSANIPARPRPGGRIGGRIRRSPYQMNDIANE